MVRHGYQVGGLQGSDGECITQLLISYPGAQAPSRFHFSDTVVVVFLHKRHGHVARVKSVLDSIW
jgi:hypothetical protein